MKSAIVRCNFPLRSEIAIYLRGAWFGRVYSEFCVLTIMFFAILYIQRKFCLTYEDDWIDYADQSNIRYSLCIIILHVLLRGGQQMEKFHARQTCFYSWYLHNIRLHVTRPPDFDSLNI